MKKLLKDTKDKNLSRFILGKLAFKIGYYQESIEIFEALVKENPSQRSYQILSKAYQMIGNVHAQQKNLTLAKSYTKY
jgi:uncharacterized protein HemY